LCKIQSVLGQNMCEHSWYFCIANLCCSSLSDILPGSFFVQYTRVRFTLIRISHELFPDWYCSYLIILQPWPIPTEVEEEQHACTMITILWIWTRQVPHAIYSPSFISLFLLWLCCSSIWFHRLFLFQKMCVWCDFSTTGSRE
jgi:hypothetical protein